MRILIFFSSKEYEIEIESSTLVCDLKKILSNDLKIRMEEQRLVFVGEMLQDQRNLEDYKIENGSKIYLFQIITEKSTKLAPQDFEV